MSIFYLRVEYYAFVRLYFVKCLFKHPLYLLAALRLALFYRCPVCTWYTVSLVISTSSQALLHVYINEWKNNTNIAHENICVERRCNTPFFFPRTYSYIIWRQISFSYFFFFFFLSWTILNRSLYKELTPLVLADGVWKKVGFIFLPVDSSKADIVGWLVFTSAHVDRNSYLFKSRTSYLIIWCTNADYRGGRWRREL